MTFGSRIYHLISLLLLNVSSLKRYLVDIFNLIDSTAPSLVILNGTDHDDNTVKHFTSHCFNYNIFFIMKESNAFDGVLIVVHKSIHSQRMTKFDNILYLIVIEVGSDSKMFQLVTCYSPPNEPISFDTFDRLLQHNPNSIFTGDFNAKHSSWSRSMENQKDQILFNWLSLSQVHSSSEIINKCTSTSTRSNATIDLIVVPSHMSSTSFSVLPSIGNDHHPIAWYPSFKMSSTHQCYLSKRTSWKIFENFLTFTATFWKSLAVAMSNSYKPFVSLNP